MKQITKVVGDCKNINSSVTVKRILAFSWSNYIKNNSVRAVVLKEV